jgi:hypothetical protein
MSRDIPDIILGKRLVLMGEERIVLDSLVKIKRDDVQFGVAT